MAAPTGVATDISRPDETVARIDLLEFRVAILTESINTAIGTMMPKVEALLSASRHEEVPTSSDSAPSTEPAPSTSLLEMAERGDGEGILRILSVRNTDIRDLQRMENGDTALHVAASRGHLKAVMVLVGAVKVDAPGHRLRTPLHCAAAHGHQHIAQRLLDMGAQVDAEDVSGTRALDVAIKENQTNMVAMLLQKRARFSNQTVFNVVSQGHCNIVELFLLNGLSADLCDEKESLLVQAARAGHWNVAELLLKRGASATKCKTPQESALRYAAEGGQADAVRLLLRHGGASDSKQVEVALGYATSAAVVWAFVDVVPDVMRGWTGTWGLVVAGSKGRLEPLVALLEAGVNIDTRDTKKQTALFLASWNGHVTCVRELLRRGADIEAKDEEGNTPLHRASIQDIAECVRTLLAAGASTTDTNNEGKTPLEVAASDSVRQLFNTTSDQP